MTDDAKRKLTPSGIAATYCSAFTSSGLSSAECRAGARAILRHQKHIDNEHYTVRNVDGLHPMYIALHGKGNSGGMEQAEIGHLLNDSLGDVFDAVTTQDRIDGGITLLLRCPGVQSASDLTVENISIDVYITPRELVEVGPKMTEQVALIVQTFGEQFALAHLRCFAARCAVEGVNAPESQSFAKQLRIEPAYLPPPESKGSARIRSRCRPIRIATSPLATPAISRSPSPEFDTDSGFWREASVVAAQYDDQIQMRSYDGPGRHQRKVKVKVEENSEAICFSSSPNHFGSSGADGFNGAIISFGPETDAILDRFQLPDSLLPRLRVLTTTVCSSRWEATLRSDTWGLSYEQAVNLSRALLADVKNEKFLQTQSSSNLSAKFAFFILFVSVLAMFAIIFA